jgi:hypothetical protein
MSKMCLSNGGKHRWRYRDDSMLGRVRECQGCGALEQRRGELTRFGATKVKWTRIDSTRWVPKTPAELSTLDDCAGPDETRWAL